MIRPTATALALTFTIAFTITGTRAEDAAAPAVTEGDAATPAEVADPLDTIGMAGLQEAFRILRSKYIEKQDLTPLEINRAALQGVVDRLEFGADLVSGPLPEPRFEPVFRGETLLGSIGYLRPATYHASELEKIDTALGGFDESTTALILDLRAPAPHGDFAVAAEIADRFTPSSTPLLKVVRPGDSRPRVFTAKREPVWPTDRNLILLVDEDSNNVAEAAAAAIAAQRDTFSLGAGTIGRTVEYQSVSIAADLTLRLAVAEAVLPDGTSLFKTGFIPELFTDGDDDGKTAAFTAPASGPLGPFVFERQRPRLNEAALVAKTNPELPYLIARTKKQTEQYDSPPPIDRLLQTTIDLLTTDAFLARPAPPAGDEPEEEPAEEPDTPDANTPEPESADPSDEGEDSGAAPEEAGPDSAPEGDTE